MRKIKISGCAGLNRITSKISIFILFLQLFSPVAKTQEKEGANLKLSLQQVITMATDSSLHAFIAENMYLADYWAFKNYKARKLPFMNLSATPLDFFRAVEQQYSFQDSSYYYIDRQTFGSGARLSLNQNITKTGGKLFIDSDIRRLDNLNNDNPTQYSATWVRVGVSQDLFGFNPYKWESRIEPLKYEQAKKEFLISMEDIALRAVNYFFDLADAQINLHIAINNLANADTLYNIGKKRFEIGSVSLEDLYTLKLDLINSKNNQSLANTNLKRAQMRLNSLLRLNNDSNISLELPENIPAVKIDPLEGLKIARENNPEMLDFRRQLLESKRNLDKTKKEGRFQANVSASFGLNQSGSDIGAAYTNPLDQEIVKLDLSIPIIDWGLAKGRYNLARRNMGMLEAQVEQSKIDFDQNVILTIEEFNLQKSLVLGTAEADTVAQFAYDVSRKRFLLGNIDLTKLNLIHRSSISAKRAYVEALERYWRYYYTIRKLTLFDFERGQTLSKDFDKMMGLEN